MEFFDFRLFKGPNKDFLPTTVSKKTPISVFVEMILNPDNMVLERLTPVIFKVRHLETRKRVEASLSSTWLMSSIETIQE